MDNMDFIDGFDHSHEHFSDACIDATHHQTDAIHNFGTDAGHLVDDILHGGTTSLMGQILGDAIDIYGAHSAADTLCNFVDDHH